MTELVFILDRILQENDALNASLLKQSCIYRVSKTLFRHPEGHRKLRLCALCRIEPASATSGESFRPQESCVRRRRPPSLKARDLQKPAFTLLLLRTQSLQ